ncbi:glycosyltransferase [Sorangium sp. So ce291]|uniref:glycosyltransferase n=1 Tax=Sorangium sp. So ce291 TaxID=3133294 RepID=UPI003F61BA3E
MHENSASVVVLTCDSYTKKHGCIEHTLLALLSQAEVNLEIVVVNNGKQPGDGEKLAQFVDSCDRDVTVVKTATSIAEARNEGARQTSRDLLVFVDEDTIVSDSLALARVVQLSQRYRHGYGARRLWTRPGSWFDEQSDKIKRDIARADYSFLLANSDLPDGTIRNKNNEKYLVRSFIGNFGFVRKEDFLAQGGFPTRFRGYGLEDDAFSFLCFVHLGEPVILDEITVVHVTHPIGGAQLDEYRANLKLYGELLGSYGYSKFHIGDLMYPETRGKRPILE